MTRITTPAALSAAIATNFPTNREFVKAFNQAGGELTEQQLSKHLPGARSLSKGWRSAYTLYFFGRATPDEIVRQAGFQPGKYFLCIADVNDVVKTTIDDIE